MTATPSQPYSPMVARAERLPHRSRRYRRGAVRDALTLMGLPLLGALALPAAFAGGGTRRWFGGRAESQRAEAQTAKDDAAAAFYELDTAQRDLRISIRDDRGRRLLPRRPARGLRLRGPRPAHRRGQPPVHRRRRRPRPGPGRPGGLGRLPRPHRTDRRQDRTGPGQTGTGPLRRGPRPAPGQGRDPAGPAGTRRRARPAGPARRLRRPGRRARLRSAGGRPGHPSRHPRPGADPAEPGRGTARGAPDARAGRTGHP
ncbi:hypothetical protein SVIOM342S_06483 [Streptomyces violaceorubidus]